MRKRDTQPSPERRGKKRTRWPRRRTGVATAAGSGGPAQDTGKTQLIEKVREIIYQTPEVRPEKVAPLAEAIETGTYEIDSEKLADILLDELLKR